MSSPHLAGTIPDPTASARRRGRPLAVGFPGEDLTISEVTARLMVELGSDADPSAVSRVVLDCRHELSGVPSGALPELLERLARQRLLHLVSTDEDGVMA